MMRTALLNGAPFLDELASKGVRSIRRNAARVIEIIQDAGEHLDALSLLEQARDAWEPNIDRATVYRTLDLLKKLRLVDELDLMHLKGEKHFYEVKTRRDHVHLACFPSAAGLKSFPAWRWERLKSELASANGI